MWQRWLLLAIGVVGVVWFIQRYPTMVKEALQTVEQYEHKVPKPVPKGFRREVAIRRELEALFLKPFPKCRPAWLRNPETNRCMELDCYSEQLQIAVEVNGPQHYMYVPFYHQDRGDFDACVRRDEYKQAQCRNRGIQLISIPYDIPINHVGAFVLDALQQKKIVDVA